MNISITIDGTKTHTDGYPVCMIGGGELWSSKIGRLVIADSEKIKARSGERVAARHATSDEISQAEASLRHCDTTLTHCDSIYAAAKPLSV